VSIVVASDDSLSSNLQRAELTRRVGIRIVTKVDVIGDSVVASFTKEMITAYVNYQGREVDS
jgi:hypothetical protein